MMWSAGGLGPRGGVAAQRYETALKFRLQDGLQRGLGQDQRGSPIPQGHRRQSYQQAPRKRRRVFLWVFLGIQALFIIWIVVGIASEPAGTPVAQQVAQQCGNGGWQGLFKSYADCTKHYAVALNDATNAGKGIGVALISSRGSWWTA